MNTVEQSVTAPPLVAPRVPVDDRMHELLARRRERGTLRGRGWLVRRALLAADLLGLSTAFLLAVLVFGDRGPGDRVDALGEFLLFVLTLPLWVVVAKLHGLYDRDEDRADHSTVDDMVSVLHLVTIGAWILYAGAWMTGLAEPELARVFAFWVLAIVFVSGGRALARSFCRRSVEYLQNTVIVGAGDVGQLIARKLLQHPEYGINLVGFVDAEPRPRRAGLEHVALLGTTDELDEIVGLYDVERVVIAFSKEPNDSMLTRIRSLRDREIQIDVVPRLYEAVGPRVGVHTVEGVPLVGLPPARLTRSSRTLKRALDVGGALVGLLLASPLLAYIAIRIRRDSPGPILFRQTRLGADMRPFTALKFRTMRLGADTDVHRDYIKATMTSDAPLNGNGMYKLDRSDAITPFGAWLRKTSLDELPQLWNVLRGDMSLVGPRPCLDYETEHFAPHHFERFLVPAGLTGLWQVTARANSTFGEALEMDVAYARGWSLGLDLRLLFRTPIQVLRQRARGTA
ncbi:MAG TPA: sugar transferase [Gaiellaceae bacterium]|nr:sugar transferase [Gaiellaceae bacterium]